MTHADPQPETSPGLGMGLADAPARRSRGFPLWLGGTVVAVDQLAKAVVRGTLALHESISVVPGLIDVTHVRNTGAAFGILNATDFPFKSTLMLVVALLAFVAIAYYATRLAAHEVLARVGLTLVLAGAVGNLIDRAVTGYVTDFVDVYWRNWHFWAFNLADASITAGAIVVILDLLGAGRHASRAV
jgi:signal peptidase II